MRVFSLFWTVQGGVDTASFDSDNIKQLHTGTLLSAVQPIFLAQISGNIKKKYDFNITAQRDPVLHNIVMGDAGINFQFISLGFGAFAGTRDFAMRDADFGLTGRVGVFFEEYILLNAKIACSIDGNGSTAKLQNPFRILVDAKFGWLVLYNIDVFFQYTEKWYNEQISNFQQIETKNCRYKLSIEIYKEDKVYPYLFFAGCDIAERTFIEKGLGRVESPNAALVFVGGAHHFEFTPIWSWYAEAEFKLNIDNIYSVGQHWCFITGIKYNG